MAGEPGTETVSGDESPRRLATSGAGLRSITENRTGQRSSHYSRPPVGHQILWPSAAGLAAALPTGDRLNLSTDLDHRRWQFSAGGDASQVFPLEIAGFAYIFIYDVVVSIGWLVPGDKL